MMSIAKELKSKIQGITGSRRLSILNEFVKNTYKNPGTALRNVTGEYSPKQIIDHLRLIMNYLKGLCLNNGSNLSKYYSYDQINLINEIVTSLHSLINPIEKNATKKLQREALMGIPDHLENLKKAIGPFLDVKPSDVLTDLNAQIIEYSENNDEFREIREQSKNDAKTITHMLQESEKLNKKSKELLSQLQEIRKDFKNQENIAQEIIQRVRHISNTASTLQKKIERSSLFLQESEKDMEDNLQKIQQAQEKGDFLNASLHASSQDIEEIKKEVEYITAQARHALHISHGAGIAESYRVLEKESRQLLPRIILFFFSTFAFLGSSALAIQLFFSIRMLPTFASIFQNPPIMIRLVAAPLTLIIFFVCIGLYRERMNKAELYSMRKAALESFFHVADRLPYDSQEKLETANYIFHSIRGDFKLKHDIHSSAKRIYT